MPRTRAYKKYQLTMNNPELHDWSHDYIKNVLGTFAGVRYWCMCDEIGEQQTPHTHLFIIFNSQVEFKSLQKCFYGAHIEPANGSNQENRDYIRKEGKWHDDEKHETNLPETFEEFGELPPDRAEGQKETAAIYEMIKEGSSDFEIMETYPNAMNKLDKITRARQTILSEQFRKVDRDIEVTYLWGAAGVGKTSSVLKTYGYENVYKVTNYTHPFDEYACQDVLLLDEFRSSFMISDLLNYLDRYPMTLPCRYMNKQACYTKVFIVSNIPLKAQYPNIQTEDPETWLALKRRIHHVYEMLPDADPNKAWNEE